MQVIFGGIDITRYCDIYNKSNYNVQMVPRMGSNGFTNINGEESVDFWGNDYPLSLKLGDVPDSIAQQISGIAKDNKVTVTFSTPYPVTTEMEIKSISAIPYRMKNNDQSWDFSISMSGFIAAGASGGGL
jgi:hypothetical protein